MGLKGDLAYWEAEDFGVDLIDLTVGELFDQRCDEAPDDEAVVYRYPELGLDFRWTYRDYRDRVERLAKGLIALGIAKGEHVAVTRRADPHATSRQGWSPASAARNP